MDDNGRYSNARLGYTKKIRFFQGHKQKAERLMLPPKIGIHTCDPENWHPLMTEKREKGTFMKTLKFTCSVGMVEPHKSTSEKYVPFDAKIKWE